MEAEQARDAAVEALRKANDAIALLKRDLHDRSAQDTEPLPVVDLRPIETGGATGRSEQMPACDRRDAGGSIGSYMLAIGPTRRQKKESSLDPSEDGTDEGINAFVYHCLGLVRATDYENVTNLSAQFATTKGTERIEAVVTRTARALKAATLKGEPALAASYNRYSLGGFGAAGSNGEAPLIDLTTSNFASGVGVLAGFEWGRMPAKSTTELEAAIHSGIAKARQECVTANMIADPLTAKDVKLSDHARLAVDQLAKCEGDALAEWMSEKKRANQYWTDIVAPLWGYKGIPESFVGIQASYAFQDLSYRPVIDPKTGAVIVTSLPDPVEIHPEPYSLKAYGGFNRPLKFGDEVEGTYGLTGSITYRREVDFIKANIGKTICQPAGPGAAFDICETDQKLAAPYDTSGFVGGIALNLQSRRFWYLPPIAISPRLTYAFDTERLGLEIPVFLLTDADGKLNSGFKVTCRFRGETSEGLELKKSCGVNLFVGTSFEIGKTP